MLFPFAGGYSPLRSDEVPIVLIIYQTFVKKHCMFLYEEEWCLLGNVLPKNENPFSAEVEDC